MLLAIIIVGMTAFTPSYNTLHLYFQMWYVVMSLRVHLATFMMLLSLKMNSLLQPGAYWEGMAKEQPYKAFDFGVCKGVEMVPPHSCEVDVIVPLPCIDLDIRYTGAQHLSYVELAVLVPFDERWAILLHRVHVFLIWEDVPRCSFDFKSISSTLVTMYVSCSGLESTLLGFRPFLAYNSISCLSARLRRLVVDLLLVFQSSSQRNTSLL
jgi:hypothetical protein